MNYITYPSNESHRFSGINEQVGLMLDVLGKAKRVVELTPTELTTALRKLGKRAVTDAITTRSHIKTNSVTNTRNLRL